jgi:hypothetical protein
MACWKTERGRIFSLHLIITNEKGREKGTGEGRGREYLCMEGSVGVGKVERLEVLVGTKRVPIGFCGYVSVFSPSHPHSHVRLSLTLPLP